MAEKKPAPPRDPTLREMRATLGRLYNDQSDANDHGRLCKRAYHHLAWLLDSYLFDTDDWADDGGRE